MNSNSQSNTEKALNNQKTEAGIELGYNYDNSNNKMTNGYSQDTLKAHKKNLSPNKKAGDVTNQEPIEGKERSVEGGEKMLVSKYYSDNNIE